MRDVLYAIAWIAVILLTLQILRIAFEAGAIFWIFGLIAAVLTLLYLHNTRQV